MILRIILMILPIFLIAGYALAAEVPEGNFDMHAITEALKQAEERAETMSAHENQSAKTGRETAESLMQQFQAPEFQATLQAESERLLQQVFPDVFAEFTPREKPGQPLGKLSADERVYLFVSSSMLVYTLRSYAAMLDKARDPNVVMVLRGFVGGMKKIKPTMEFIGSILKKDPACEMGVEKCDSHAVAIQIDPQLFQRFRIEQVPTVVYASGLKSDGKDPEEQEFSIAGDAGLDWLLEKINREAKSRTLDSLISSLRHGGEHQ